MREKERTVRGRERGSEGGKRDKERGKLESERERGREGEGERGREGERERERERETERPVAESEIGVIKCPLWRHTNKSCFIQTLTDHSLFHALRERARASERERKRDANGGKYCKCD